MKYLDNISKCSIHPDYRQKKKSCFFKRLICTLFLGIILCMLIDGSVFAKEEDTESLTDEITQSQYDALELDELYKSVDDDTLDMLDGVSILDADFSEGVRQIFNAVGSKLGNILKNATGSAAVIMAIAILCSLVGSVYDESGEAVPSYVSLTGVLAITAVTLGSTSSFLSQGMETLEKVESFSKTLLPILSTLATTTGAYTSASVKYMAMLLFVDVLITVAKNVFMPLIYAYIAVSVANAAFGGGSLQGVANVLKWMANMILTAIMLTFVAYISISGIVSSTADAATTRVAKTVISTAIPVVGSIISDVASSIVSGAGLVKSAVGVFGLLIVLALTIVPFLRLGASYLMYKLSSGLSASLTNSTLSKLIGDLGSAFGMVMGLIGAGTIMMFFGILSLIKVVSG